MPDTPANVLDFLPKEEHTAIRAGRSGYDCTAGIQKAIDGSRRVLIPAGVYPVKQLNLRSGLELYGEGASSELRSFDDSLASEFMKANHQGAGAAAAAAVAGTGGTGTGGTGTGGTGTTGTTGTH